MVYANEKNVKKKGKSKRTDDRTNAYCKSS